MKKEFLTIEETIDAFNCCANVPPICNKCPCKSDCCNIMWEGKSIIKSNVRQWLTYAKENYNHSSITKETRPLKIEYTSKDGYKGMLYNWHYDDYIGEFNYSMSISDMNGKEVLHAYNATPKTRDELIDIVNSHGSMKSLFMKIINDNQAEQ